MDKNTDGSQILLNRAVDVYIDEWVKVCLFLYLGVTQRRDTSPSTPAFSYDPTYLPVTKAGRKLR